MTATTEAEKIDTKYNTSVMLTIGLRDRLAKQAKRLDVTSSFLVRRAVERMLETLERGEQGEVSG